MFNKKKDYFKKKLTGVRNLIWDMEFKRYQLLRKREDYREQYDNAMSKQSALKAQIDSITASGAVADGKLTDQLVLLDKEIENHKEWMDGLDAEVNGLPRSNEHPEGVQGINQQIEALIDLRSKTKDFINEL